MDPVQCGMITIQTSNGVSNKVLECEIEAVTVGSAACPAVAPGPHCRS